jgi:hypothetical protein
MDECRLRLPGHGDPGNASNGTGELTRPFGTPLCLHTLP